MGYVMKKISSKISAVIVVCSCVAIAIIGGMSIVEGGQMIRNDAEDKLEWMARHYAAQFSNELDQITYNVEEMEVHFRDTFDMEQMKADPDYLSKYEPQLADYLFNFASKRASGIAAWCYFNPELSNTPHDVYYVDGDSDGIPDRQNYIPFSYYDETPTPTDDKQWWYGPIETKKGFWTNPYEWEVKNGHVIKVVSYAQPIFIDGQLIAVIGTYYHFDKVMEDISNIKVYASGYATLYNEKMDVIIHPDYKSGTRYTSDNMLTIEDGKYSDLWTEIGTGDHGIVNYEKDGENRLMAYSKLSNGWIMGINPAEAELMAGINILTFKLVGAEILCMILSVIAAYFIGIGITKSLRKVVSGAKQIGSGDLDVKIEVKTRDEIQTVADSINEMVANTKELQGKLARLAYYDDLTGIPNMNLFKINVNKAIVAEGNHHAYVILDVNKFKVMNDIFGYAHGDTLLKHIAYILSLEFTENEVISRYSGDVFHIFCHFVSRQELEERLESVAIDISNFVFDTRESYRISVCFGVYVVDNPHLLVEMMGDYADFAVKKIKSNYITSIYFYNDEIRNRIIEEQEIENEMQRGIDNEDFQVYIQPKYSLKTMKIQSGEALVRWQHPQKGFLPPDTFIGVFEKNGFITKLDMYMLENVCKELRKWMDSGMDPVVISVNQSRLHLNNPNYLNLLVKMLKIYGIEPQWIELEITESVFFEDMEQMITIINRLHELGFKISMDDFGSGYSSLNMLSAIDVDILKIDQKFFNESSNNIRGRQIVGNIISMVSGLGIVVVAEGVETKEQVEFLKFTECDMVQGYYFAKPMPINEFEIQLRNQQEKI